MQKTLIAATAALSIAGCTTGQIDASAKLLAVIGTDAVNIECSPTAQNLIQVIAIDLKASQRVQNSLAQNSKVALDACPTLQEPIIKVITGAITVVGAK